jgi:threonine dehydratase
MNNQVSVQTIEEAAKKIEGVVSRTPLWFSKRLSKKYHAKIYLKREDLQEVRSYKIRGAYNLMSSLSDKERKAGVVCASAGNHAQGVALSASSLKIKAVIFMPVITPLQKINRVRHFGDGWIEIKLVGKTYDESLTSAKEYCKKKKAVFIHPFDDYRVISGQGTVAKEIFDKLGDEVNYVFCPIGGGGLISGVSTYMKSKSNKTEVVGVEPMGAAGMYESIKKGKVVTLQKIDTFVDGAAVKTIGEKTFAITKKLVKQFLIVEEGKVCTFIIDLYQNEGIVAEPAGALSVTALDLYADKIKGKTVVCILSGGNNDVLRYPEIMEKSLVYLGLRHYFLIEFGQKPGQLRKFVDSALGPNDDITRFEYIKKNSKEIGPALVGIELSDKNDLESLTIRMNKLGLTYVPITSSDLLYGYLI